jgi:hypothetical protein
MSALGLGPVKTAVTLRILQCINEELAPLLARAVANRRRTQVDDFENLEIAYPPTFNERHGRIAEILKARAASILAQEMLRFSNIVDGRGDEVLPEVTEDAAPEEVEPE